MQYNDGYAEEIFTYVNNVNTKDGGTHLSGYRSALTRTINSYAVQNGYLKNMGITLSGEDVREGLVAVLSVKIPEPQFEGQTKGRLGNSEVKGMVEQIVNEKGLVQITDTEALEDVVSNIISAHPKEVDAYRNGKTKLLGFFVGQAMKETKGKANPKLVNEIMKRQLDA